MPMQSITPALNDDSSIPLYRQLYAYIRDAILSGHIQPGEKLPSLRSLSKSLGLSLSTVEQAYSQLSVEGYLNSKPQSGYYANSIPLELRRPYGGRNPLDQNIQGRKEAWGFADARSSEDSKSSEDSHGSEDDWNSKDRRCSGDSCGSGDDWSSGDARSFTDIQIREDYQETVHDLSLSAEGGETTDHLYFDPATFDLYKWKKCLNQILNDHAPLLFQEGDPRGEAPLRFEISKYIYQVRGVLCTPRQIVIGAGTQQLTGLLCILLRRMGIDLVALEEPGYLPVRDIFRTHSFKMSPVAVENDGIQIEKLPANITSAAYVSPSNQFPTGSVMPIARRYALLDWASQNQSIIIEDDYNSELRYSGKPVPSLQGLDQHQQVVYLGSFSSTLFPSVKISYMVLPVPMLRLFAQELSGYTQTCSKTEQLTLALYMEKGLYQTGVRKLRTLYAQKLQTAAAVLRRCFQKQIHIQPAYSGLQLSLYLKLPPHMSPELFCQLARQNHLLFSPVTDFRSKEKGQSFLFYYTRVPLALMESSVEQLWKAFRESGGTDGFPSSNLK